MQLVYLDEAGISNETQEPYLVVAGVIVNPDRKWRDLENYFLRLTRKCFPDHEGRPIVFHAKDIWHGSGLFERKVWPLKKRLRLLDELIEIPAKFDLPLVMGHIDRRAARQWLAVKQPNISPKAARAIMHAWAFVESAKRVENWMFKNARDEVAMLIAEDTPDVKNAIHDFHSLYTDRSSPPPPIGAFVAKRIVDTVHFAKKDQSLLLQIADHSAFFMKRKLMKRADSERFFSKIAPQIAWQPVKASGLALLVKASDLTLVTKPGTLPIGQSDELLGDFNAIFQGARSGLGKDILSDHLQRLRAAQDQAFRTEQGQNFLRRRPTLRQHIVRLARLQHPK